MVKDWYKSKTLWVNAIAFSSLLAQTVLGFVIDPAEQAGILAVVNLVLRAITSEPLLERYEK